jgi:hypothetical protein
MFRLKAVLLSMVLGHEASFHLLRKELEARRIQQPNAVRSASLAVRSHVVQNDTS